MFGVENVEEKEISKLFYNGSRLCDGGVSRHKCSNYPHSLIELQMFNKPHQPHYCKTDVMRSAVG